MYFVLYFLDEIKNVAGSECLYVSFFFGINPQVSASVLQSATNPGRAASGPLQGKLSERCFFHPYRFQARDLMVKGCKPLPLAPTSVGQNSYISE